MRSCIRVDAAYQLIIQLVLAIDAQTAAAFAQTLGLPNRWAAEEASLGKLLLTSHFPSGMCTVSGSNWLRLSMQAPAGSARRGRIRPRSWSSAFMTSSPTQVHQVIHVVLGAPFGLDTKETVP